MSLNDAFEDISGSDTDDGDGDGDSDIGGNGDGDGDGFCALVSSATCSYIYERLYKPTVRLYIQ
jgi:hypothetical protein